MATAFTASEITTMTVRVAMELKTAIERDAQRPGTRTLWAKEQLKLIRDDRLFRER
jgi:hypothetical protein